MTGTLLGSGLPERIRETVITGMSFVVIALGTKMALETFNMLIVLGSISLGGMSFFTSRGGDPEYHF